MPVALEIAMIVSIFPTSIGLAVDGYRAVFVGVYAMPAIGRIDVHTTGADVHVLATALIFHMDTAPSHVDLFSFFGVDNVDALF